MDVVRDNALVPTQDGAIEEYKIVSYQVAIDELLRAGRYDTYLLLISNLNIILFLNFFFFLLKI